MGSVALDVEPPPETRYPRPRCRKAKCEFYSWTPTSCQNMCERALNHGGNHDCLRHAEPEESAEANGVVCHDAMPSSAPHLRAGAATERGETRRAADDQGGRPAPPDGSGSEEAESEEEDGPRAARLARFPDRWELDAEAAENGDARRRKVLEGKVRALVAPYGPLARLEIGSALVAYPRHLRDGGGTLQKLRMTAVVEFMSARDARVAAEQLRGVDSGR